MDWKSIVLVSRLKVCLVKFAKFNKLNELNSEFEIKTFIETKVTAIKLQGFNL